jgi:methyl-accepting chemotaxis protein
MSERDRIERLNQVLCDLEQTLSESEQASGERTRGVTLLIRVVVVLIAAFALANLYFINDLTQEVRVVIAGMDAMSGHIERIAGRMGAMEQSVAAIGGDVHLMPVFSAQMQEIAGHVQGLQDSVADMQQSTDHLHGRIGRMQLSIADMAARFHGLNQAVGGMGVDVNQMAKPVP